MQKPDPPNASRRREAEQRVRHNKRVLVRIWRYFYRRLQAQIRTLAGLFPSCCEHERGK